MPSIVNKRGLLCNKSRALFLLEYKHELSLLKKLILITEKGIGGILPKDTWCYEGICHLFASSIVSHARMAYDNMLLGHFDAANMVLRALIEKLWTILLYPGRFLEIVHSGCISFFSPTTFFLSGTQKDRQGATPNRSYHHFQRA